MFRICCVAVLAFLSAVVCQGEKPVDYTGHKVLTVYPGCEADLVLLLKLRQDYGVDLWNEPTTVHSPVMVRLSPDLEPTVVKVLNEKHIRFEVAISDVQRAIAVERIQHSPMNYTQDSVVFDHGRYHPYNEVEQFLKNIAAAHPELVTMKPIGYSYENRPIHELMITSGTKNVKPVIMIECGIHSREWTAIAACLYTINKLTEPEASPMTNKYEIHIVPVANPDGHVYTWTQDRLWRKTRSRSELDWMGNCRGADANRNFDIEHCGVGTSRKPCEDIYCGDAPFSESETRAIRDWAIGLRDRVKCYFSIHAFSQLWMTPWGIKKSLPPNYQELSRIGLAGATALGKKYGTQFRVGSIANIIYEAAGSSVDYMYEKQNMKTAFALELRDTGRYGFFLHQSLILPSCEETYDGLQAAILAL